MNQSESNKTGWNQVAHSYAGEEAGEDDPEMRQQVRERFSSQLRGTRVLEIGCGPGTDAAKFAEEGLVVTATDFSSKFIDIIKKRYPALDARVMDMTQPDLKAEIFDGIFGFSSFIHIPRKVSLPTLKSLRELLVEDGLLALYLIESSKAIEEYKIENWAGDKACSMLFTCHSRDGITQLLTEAGYVSIVTEDAPYSRLYAEMPRLKERGITGYLTFARRPGK